MHVGLPVLFLILTIISFVWLGIALRKHHLSTSIIVSWMTFNIVFLVIFVYLTIIGIVYQVKQSSFDYGNYNFLDWIARNIFGINFEGSWVILILITIFVLAISISINVVIKLSSQNKKINDLNRNLAILKGKVAIDMNELNFDTSELSADELKHLLEEQLSKEKLKAKYKSKIAKLSKTSTTNLMIDTKTLLNLSKNKNKQKIENDRNNEV
ncbi:MAG: hypothetical protein HDR43_01470 [Mycoplasma sp.]|nr:hypothetical protein [Mycoplasma sp.]